jgi:hypothetical protein
MMMPPPEKAPAKAVEGQAQTTHIEKNSQKESFALRLFLPLFSS